MFKNYLVTSWRNLKRNSLFSIISIVGLAIGMAACFLILEYVNFELSYDRFNKNVSDLYRVTNDRYQNGKLVQHGTITYSGVGKALQDDYPEVVNHSRVEPWGPGIISIKDKKVGNQYITAVDNSFLSMFSLPFLAGDPGTALKEVNDIVLTKDCADRIFGDQHGNYGHLIGKSLIIQKDTLPYKVTGIMENFPENSHFRSDILVSYVSVYAGSHGYKEADYDFTDSDFWHYIQLKHGTNYKSLEAKLGAFSDRHFQGNKVSGSVEKFYLQPVADAHLYSDYEYEIGNVGSATVVWGLMIIALFIIAIAWVNYVNLSTARSVERAKEVGIRKVTGATRSELIRQFLVESLIINMAAFVLAIIMVSFCQEPFNRLLDAHLSYHDLFREGWNGYALPLGLGMLMLTGIIVSASYPAFVMSAFKPISVLKGKFKASSKGALLRKGLVIAQFSITILLMIGSVVVYNQIRFMRNQELGMNIDHMMIVYPPVLSNFDSAFIARMDAFKNELRQIPGVTGAATANRTAGNEMGRGFDGHRADDKSGTKYTIRNMGVDGDFVPLYGIKILAGRTLDAGDYNASYNLLRNVLISAAAVKLLGFPSNEGAIGKGVVLFGKTWTVVGVIADFHQKSFRYSLEPTMLLPFYGNYNWISVKISSQNVGATTKEIRKKYDAFFPGNFFDYSFLDESYNKQYKDDQLFQSAFAIFAGLAIFIACLGLLGLSLFDTSQRIKEIGIRKVLGASVANIVFLLSQSFIRLVGLSFLIAAPVSWLLMHHWLDNFAYRINLNPFIFIGAGALAVLIALGTISVQAIKAAMSSPVRNLRVE
jgi:putative ABC transport system permease protein